MFWKIILAVIAMLLAGQSYSDTLPQIAETIQIYTHFREMIGTPSWLLILRDEQTGQVLPYVYEIKQDDNFWLALSPGHSYRVTHSLLKFDPFPARIKNFCHLENGTLNGVSMMVTLSGDLTPDRKQVKCSIKKYQHGKFNIVREPTL